jgi:hypothetical protein
MTAEMFVKWFPHMAKCKFSGPFKLLRDCATSHTDIAVVDRVHRYEITLFSLHFIKNRGVEPYDNIVPI